MPRKKATVRNRRASKGKRATSRKASARRPPPSPIVFRQPGTLSFAILRDAQVARDRAARNETA